MDIKIRAWDAKRGKMLEGDFIEDCYPRYRVSLAYGKVEIFDTTGGNLEELTTMLSTGLYDKNGKDIYEGDIVQHGLFALNDTTKFGPECWAKLPEDVKEDDITSTISVFAVDRNFPLLEKLRWLMERNPDVEGCEIIGNIYEHSHLLK